MKVYKTANAHKEKGVEQRQHGNPIKSAGEVNLQEEGYARFNPPGGWSGCFGDGRGCVRKRETQSFSEASGAHQQWCVHMSALSQRRSQIHGISERCVGQCECPQTQWPQEKTAKTSCHGDIHPPSQRKHGLLERE